MLLAIPSSRGGFILAFASGMCTVLPDILRGKHMHVKYLGCSCQLSAYYRRSSVFTEQAFLQIQYFSYILYTFI